MDAFLFVYDEILIFAYIIKAKIMKGLFRLYLASFYLLSATQLIAQRVESVQFETKEHDFGTIAEQGGKVYYEFRFVNKGVDPLTVTNVQASCGCTVPEWPSEAIAPEGHGHIKVAYDPMYRPGKFYKTITVNLDREAPVVLSIKGEVSPKPRTVEEDFPTVIGELRFVSRYLNMGKITNDKPLTKSFDFYNQSEDSIMILDNFVLPEYIELYFEQNTIAPGERAAFTIKYDPVRRNDLGFMNDSFVFFTNEEHNSQKQFNVYTTIVEFFPPMTKEELEKAARISIEKQEYDFGNIKEGSVYSHYIELSNKGNSDLFIRKIAPNCDCITIENGIQKLAAGEKTVVNFRLDTKDRRGQMHKKITFYTNDPRNPQIDFTLKAKVNLP